MTSPGTTYRSNWLVTLFSYSSGYLMPCSLRADPTFNAIHINTNQLTTAVKMTAPYRRGRGTKADVMAPAHGVLDAAEAVAAVNVNPDSPSCLSQGGQTRCFETQAINHCKQPVEVIRPEKRGTW